MSNESKHTPGPWGTEEINGHLYVTEAADDAEGMICLVEADRTHNENRANAALIAAAPAMYEALKAVYDNAPMWDVTPGLAKALKQAKAALALAGKGE